MSTAIDTSHLSLDTVDIVGPDHYAQNGYPHAEWALLRREAPVFYYDRHDSTPFWAVTKHEDIIFLSKQPKRFLNEPRLFVDPENDNRTADDEGRHLLIMDPPQHHRYRKLVSSRFTPGALRKRLAEFESIAVQILDDISTEGETAECDFVEKVSSILPLAVIADMLGVPREDWKLMFRWTNEVIGAGSGDDEYIREGETRQSTQDAAVAEMEEYFGAMALDRLKEPRDDLVSAVLHSRLDGQMLPPENIQAYFNLIVIAGNETTRNATSGGLLALIENPGELEKLRRDPSLIKSAVEEIVRWTTPVIQFCRTASEDVELRGQKIREGEAFCLFYPSANRDEDVFDDPFAFRVDRDPNPHLAFGIGEHFCLGANVARLEMQIMFRHLIERLGHVELAGPVERLRSSFLGGVKHMPIRYSLV
jgi:cytochrome P450